MKHWTQESATENPGVAAAETFAKHFIVQDEEGSILRDDLYHTYVKWATQRGHEFISERPFLEAVTDHVQVETSAMTLHHEWVQQFDGIGLSLVDAF